MAQTITKRPDELRLYDFNFSGKEELANNGETLVVGSMLDVTIVTGVGLTKGSPVISTDGQKVQVPLSAGTDGVTYFLKCRVDTSGGKILGMYGYLKVSTLP